MIAFASAAPVLPLAATAGTEVKTGRIRIAPEAEDAPQPMDRRYRLGSEGFELGHHLDRLCAQKAGAVLSARASWNPRSAAEAPKGPTLILGTSQGGSATVEWGLETSPSVDRIARRVAAASGARPTRHRELGPCEIRIRVAPAAATQRTSDGLMVRAPLESLARRLCSALEGFECGGTN